MIEIESGQPISIYKELRNFRLPVICVDARHMAAVLFARINKNDKNDAKEALIFRKSVVIKKYARSFIKT
ncbi:hypothetical protein [Wolbachia endosymbiont of Cantharis cryptica]|uniref:hypothetical protein n=1 Tax=Wolbachia endosymbiont of Cantharis cryptica TaxID=3066132 RepID=UPI00376F3501